MARREALLCINSRMRSFVLERFPVLGRAKMPGVLLFVVPKLSSQGIVLSPHRCPGRTLCGCTVLAPCALLPARVSNYRSGLSHKSVPSVQGALFAEQKDLDGMRGYSFNKPHLSGKKDAVTCFELHAGPLFPPKRSASLLLPAAVPAPGSVAFHWGIG